LKRLQRETFVDTNMKETAQMITDEKYVGIYPEDLFSESWWNENNIGFRY